MRSQAKKISEIHAAAQAELGMVVPGLLPSLAALPALPRGLAPGQAADVELFPAFKGGGARPRRPPCPPLIGPPLPSSAFRAGGARTADLPCVGDGAGKQASSCIVVRQRRHAGADVPRSLPPLSRAVCAPTSEKIVIVGRWAGACAHARLLPHADDSWQAAGKQRSSYFGTPSRRPRPRARLLARADDGWETVGKKRSTSRVDGRQVSSAFLGEYTPVPAGAPPAPRPPPAAAPPPPPPAAPAPAPEPAAPAAPKCGPCLAAGLERGSFLRLCGAAEVVRAHRGL